MRRLGLVLVLVSLGGCASTQTVAPKQTAAPEQTEPTTASLRAGPASVRRSSWSQGGADGQVLETPNHRVFTTVVNPVIAERLPSFVEDSLLQYRSAFGTNGQLLPAPPKPITSYVMATRGEWATLTAEQLPAHRARRYLQIERGGFAENGIGYYFDIGTQDTFAVAAHEGWHQYTQTTFAMRMPSWLDEGCATYCEGFRWDRRDRDRAVFSPWANVERFDRLRDAHRVGTLLSLRELVSARPEVLLAGSTDATLDYYAQLWALIHFLREGEGGRYSAGLTHALNDAATGKMRSALRGRGSSVGQTVFTVYVSNDFDRLDREYRAFVDSVVEPGSKQAIVAGRNPLSAP